MYIEFKKENCFYLYIYGGCVCVYKINKSIFPYEFIITTIIHVHNIKQ